MVHIKTSVQAKESILKNAAALEPVQDGDRYTYTIHTPLEDKLEKAVAFQVFVTIPRQLDSLESFTVQGANVELAIGNISHTFIRNLSINNSKGDISIDNFYGESATISSTTLGGISGKYSVARLIATTKSGRIFSDVHLLNTDDQLPSPKVVCSATNSRIDLNVDGSDLFGPFTVEAKTQCAHLETKILLASTEQRLLGNFINFGGPTRIRMSGNFQAGSSSNGSDSHSRAESMTGSLNENRSVNGGPLSPLSRTEKQRKKDEERDSIITREMIGTIGQGTGLIMAKNSSGDITVELI
ncbi:hypothetical protein BGZ67_000646 [Mortierella alpina]|nr:hypothetical protein BGZ67_000646 [Mortierella alpina]